MPDAIKDEARRRDYGLFVRPGARGLALKLADEGVALTDERLFWANGGGEETRPLSDISGVHLTVAHITRHGDFGSCEIRFEGSAPLQVVASSAFGFPDEQRSPVYAAFIRDLHASLAQRPAGTVRFSAGVSEGRLRVMQVLLIIAGLLFVALPLVLLLLSGELGMLAAALAGGILVAGLYGWTEKNRPRGYDPRRVPPELLP
ncbi:hypothetical protein WBO78_09165 [Bosea sp. CCNWLW174]|uniref:hypothetical protein n=1 Tax=unclassified Bosea (in: a-proteobacteria) TaxID=2653178 RepID=UPI0030142758